MEGFCEAYTALATRERDEHGHSFIRIEDLIALPVFAAFCSGSGREVFLRGCTGNFGNSLPSLFRNIPDSEVAARWQDYKCLLRELSESPAIKGKGLRWERSNLGAVLQHYGIKTPWLDVVRNLHTAVWFASHDLRHKPCKQHETVQDDCQSCGSRGFVRSSCQAYGWISFYTRDALCSAEHPCFNEKLIVQDIPCEQSSRHFRPHAQQGLSLAMQNDPGEQKNEPVPEKGLVDLNRYRIAHVRFPNKKEWAVCGHMFSTRFLFPPQSQDASLKQLLSDEVRNILNRFKFKLGRVTDYSPE